MYIALKWPVLLFLFSSTFTQMAQNGTCAELHCTASHVSCGRAWDETKWQFCGSESRRWGGGRRRGYTKVEIGIELCNEEGNQQHWGLSRDDLSWFQKDESKDGSEISVAESKAEERWRMVRFPGEGDGPAQERRCPQHHTWTADCCFWGNCWRSERRNWPRWKSRR